VLIRYHPPDFSISGGGKAMTMNRRAFIYAAGGATIAPAAATLSASPSDSFASVRAAFALDPTLVHMTGLLLASHPLHVRTAIELHRTGLDRNPVEYFGANWASAERACYESAAAYLKTAPDQIALTDSTTMGLGILYAGLELKPEQEVLTTEHDHYATHESLKNKAATSGAIVRKVRLYKDSARASVDEIVGNITAGITARTRVLAVTWVHSGTGVKIPLRRIGEEVTKANKNRKPEEQIIYCVDGVHGFGIEDISVEDLGCDFFAAGCHKWVFGPRGTGVLWGKKDSWQWVRPVIPSFNALFYQSAGSRMTPGGFHSFEMRWSLPEAFKFHQQLGKSNVQARIHALNTDLKIRMQKISGVRMYTPLSSELSSGIVCFDVDGMKPSAVVAALRKENIIASTTPYEVSYARLTPGLLNDEKDIERAAAAVAKIAAHGNEG
jgi:selenocysteine lyase/cysteine desulfurase